jgi:hypothetical protein
LHLEGAIREEAMLNKEEILNKLKQLPLDPQQYCIMTGAALVIYGVRPQTADIDLGCTEAQFDELIKRGYEAGEKKGNLRILIEDTIEIYRNWLPEKIVYIEGLPLADILCIRDYKQSLGREKDLVDLELIEHFLKKG